MLDKLYKTLISNESSYCHYFNISTLLSMNGGISL
jgi:hypothetical protein